MSLLPKPSIDTGLGLERMITLMQGVDAVWETDLMRPLIDQASRLTDRPYLPGDYEDRASFSLRASASSDADIANVALVWLRMTSLYTSGSGNSSTG